MLQRVKIEAVFSPKNGTAGRVQTGCKLKAEMPQDWVRQTVSNGRA
jgi:hypothetical protein